MDNRKFFHRRTGIDCGNTMDSFSIGHRFYPIYDHIGKYVGCRTSEVLDVTDDRYIPEYFSPKLNGYTTKHMDLDW